MCAYAPRRRRPGRLVALAAVMILTACGDKQGGTPTTPVTPDPPASPAHIEVVAGNEQYGAPGTPLSQALVVRVTASDGAAVPNAIVGFAITRGGGTLSATSATTASDGTARLTSWTLGGEPGLNLVTAQVVETSLEVEFRAIAAERPVTLSMPGDTILYGGEMYEGSVVVDSSALVAVTRDGEMYLYYAGLGPLPQALSHETSRTSLRLRMADLLGELLTPAPGTLQLAAHQLGAAGVDANHEGGGTFTLSNTKRRMVGLKFGSSNLPPRILEPRGALASVASLRSLLGESGTSSVHPGAQLSVTLSEETTCEVFGSLVWLNLVPYGLWAQATYQGRGILQAASADPVYFAQVNVFDAALLAVAILDELAQVVEILPCGDVLASFITGASSTALGAAMQDYTGPGPMQEAVSSTVGSIFQGLAGCACDVTPAGPACAVADLIATVWSLGGFVVDDVVLRSYDVLATPVYGKVILTPDVTPGTLDISIAGLPGDAPAQVEVSGPSGFNVSVPRSAELAGLTPGEYTITATHVVWAGTRYEPTSSEQVADVAAGSGSSASVLYLAAGTQPAPTAVTLAPSYVGPQTFTMNASVDPRGLPTQAVFLYATDPSLAGSSSTPLRALDGETGSRLVSASVTVTESETPYYYRVVASSAAGVTQGDVVAVTPEVQVSARLDHWNGTTTQVEVGHPGTVSFTFTNTGTTTWTFGVDATLRAPDASTEALATKSVTVEAGSAETVSWTHTYDHVGSWDVRGNVWKEGSSPSTLLASSGWLEDHITVTPPPEIVDATIDHWNGTQTTVAEGASGVVRYTFTNAGTAVHTFGAQAELRKPDGSSVDLGVQSVTVGAGESVAVEWSHTFDVPGSWDVSGTVWDNPATRTNPLASSGWLEDHITVTAQQVVSATLDHWNGTQTSVLEGESGTVSYTFSNTGNVTWTFGAGATLRRPDGSNRDLELRRITLAPGTSHTVTWTHTYDSSGSWDLIGTVWRDPNDLQTSLASSGWMNGYVTVAARVTAAAIADWSGTNTSVQEGQSGVIRFTVTNTGNTAATFGAQARLRKPDGSTVVDLGIQAVSLQPGTSQAVSWAHTYDVPGAWDVEGLVRNGTTEGAPLLDDSGWKTGYVTVTAQEVVRARFESWDGTDRGLTAGSTGTVQIRFANTGSQEWTFGITATLRKPDGTEVALGLKSATVAQGASQTISWTHTYDTDGSWDVKATVWKESSSPVTALAESGWQLDYITVAPVTVAASLDDWAGTSTTVTEGESATVRFAMTNTGDVAWTYGAQASLRRPDGSTVDLGPTAVTLTPGASTTVSWSYAYDTPGAWDVRGIVWKESGAPYATALADSGWKEDYVTVAAAEVVAARIDGWAGTTTTLDENQTATVRLNFTNTGNVPWSYGAQAWLRAPDGTEIDLGQQPAAADAGASRPVDWTHALDQAGSWDVKGVVWKEDPGGTTALDATGWVEDYITVNAAPEITASIVGFLNDSHQGLDQAHTLRVTVQNTSAVAWTFGVHMAVQRPDGSEVDLGLQAVTLAASESSQLSFGMTPDMLGDWKYRAQVWKESTSPVTTQLADSGWLSGVQVLERLGVYVTDWVGGQFTLGSDATVKYRLQNNTSRPLNLWADLVIRRPDGTEFIAATNYLPLSTYAGVTVQRSFTVDQVGSWDAKVQVWLDVQRTTLVTESAWQTGLVGVGSS